MSEFEDAQRILSECQEIQSPHFGSAGELFRGIQESHGVLYALSSTLAKSGQINLNCLEIGSFAGASALTWAWCIDENFSGNGSVTCLDLWDELSTEEIDPTNTQYQKKHMAMIYEIFQANVKHSPHNAAITHHKFDIERYQSAFPEQKFDLIYIDGDHTHQFVSKDIEIASALLKTDGVLCGDDLSLQANEVDVDALENALNQNSSFIQDPRTGINYHPGVTAAVWQAFNEVSKYGATWYVQKTETGWKNIDLAGAQVEFPPHFPRS